MVRQVRFTVLYNFLELLLIVLISYGHAALKPHLLNDMRITLIPAFIEQIKYVPLPQIIYSDNQFEIAIENMVLQGDTLMPDIFEVKVMLIYNQAKHDSNINLIVNVG